MQEPRPRRIAASESRTRAWERSGLAERPDRIALWAVLLAVVAMIAGAASAEAGSSGGIGAGGGGGGAGQDGDAGGGGGGGTGTDAEGFDCSGPKQARECDELDSLDWARELATWYGPGFFGNQTACGKELSKRTIGVAHKSLPCGAPVMVRYKGEYVRAKVIDRGPYANGAEWDLTQATARAIDFEYTDKISVARLRG